MTEEQFETAGAIVDDIWKAVHDLVDKKLEDVDTEIAEQVRLQLTETFRFWRRI